MGSLPREKAGVGSAVNDTTRQVGGALGVAIIGSVVSSVYATQIGSAASQFGLNPTQTATAQSSLGAAQGVAAQLGDQAAGFLSAASDGFVDALSIGLRISAFVVVIAAIVAWRFLPSHAREATMPGLPLVDPVDDDDTVFFGPGAFDGALLTDAEVVGSISVDVDEEAARGWDQVPIPVAGS